MSRLTHMYLNTSFRPGNKEDVATYDWIKSQDSRSERMRELGYLGREAERVLGPQWLHLLHAHLVEQEK